ncbi:MAG: nucleotide exchange factor GrpE [Oscillospiraceae bacterium]|nr:nucleotide exchange factor GrpE [Oscillospiraceae bacterium]
MDKKDIDIPLDDPVAAESPPKTKKSRAAADTAALAAEVEALKQSLAEAGDAYQRMLAEYANYKRRTEQEKEQLGLYIRCELIRALLPTLDSFDLAAGAPPGEEYKAGVEMVLAGLHKLLAEQGLEEIPALGEAFDPEIHNAVMREDAGEGTEHGVVTEVFQKGYRIGDRVIRPAMVKVAN